MPGKRTHSRADVSVPVSFRYGTPAPLPGTLINLSEGGAAILTLTPPRHHTHLYFDLVLPDGTPLGQILGQIVAVREPDKNLLEIIRKKHPEALKKSRTTPYLGHTMTPHLVRIRFAGLTEEHRSAIRKFIRPFGTKVRRKKTASKKS